MSSLDPTADVAHTLRELGVQLDQWSLADEVPGDPIPFDGLVPDVVDEEQAALFASLGIDAVIKTNAAMSQRSLRDFLR